MSRVRIAYVQGPWRDKKTGRIYIRFRRRGRKSTPLPGPIGSQEFWDAYQQALGVGAQIGAELRSKAGSFSAAIAAYKASQVWAQLSLETRTQRGAILERLRVPYGEFPMGRITRAFVIAWLETLKPHAARAHLKTLRGLLQHAGHDVTVGIKPPKAKSKKHASWTAEELAAYEARHPIGSKARLTFALARWTGAGRSEIARIGPQHIRDGEISISRQKTGVEAGPITVHPELKKILELTPVTGLDSFLVTESGTAFVPNNLSKQFRTWCDEAGLPAHCKLHGLRHTMGDAIAERGGTPNEVAALLGHAGVRSALHYSQGANRKIMARRAMQRLISGTSDEPAVSNHDPILTLASEKALKNGHE